MKRFMLIVSIFLIAASVLVAKAGDTDIADFTIKAFKAGQGIKLLINNRVDLNDILEIADGSTTDKKGTDIKLNSVIDQVLGSSAGLQQTGLSSFIIFSYRLEGGLSGRYTISFDVSPLKRDGSDHVIRSVYQIGNFNTVFVGSAADTGQTNTRDGWRIEQTDTAVKTEEPDSSGNPEFSKVITISDANGSVPSEPQATPNWAARGAVGIVVSYSDYIDNEIAPYGMYYAPVTVRVTAD